MKIIVWGCLIAQMKRLDALVTTQKTPTLKTVPLLKKSGKTTKKRSFLKKMFYGGFSWFFQQLYIAKSWGFLRCNQCIQTLHLSYQTPPYNDFHFSGYNGFLQFFRPPVPGVQHKILFIFRILSVFLWHKAYTTIQKRTNVEIVPPLLADLFARVRAASGSLCLSWMTKSQKVPDTWGKHKSAGWSRAFLSPWWRSEQCPYKAPPVCSQSHPARRPSQLSLQYFMSRLRINVGGGWWSGSTCDRA